MDRTSATVARLQERLDHIEWLHGQVVYFLQGNTGGRIKIGTTGDLSRRLVALQTASPTRLRVLVTLRGGPAYESEMHERFAKYRHHGEWFEPSRALLRWIDKASTEDFQRQHEWDRRVWASRQMMAIRAPFPPEVSARVARRDLEFRGPPLAEELSA